MSESDHYEEVRRAVGRGVPSLLLGTSSRSLDRSVQNLKTAADSGTPKVATRSAVHAVLLAAGFTEHVKGTHTDSFEIGAGKVRGRYEVIVGAWFERQDWRSLEAMWAADEARLEEYLRHIRSAGFGAVIEDQRVIVTPAEEERP